MIDELANELESGRRFGRRSLLCRTGAAALAVGGAFFGTTDVARAATCGCCNLVYCPPTTDYNTCVTNNHYLWGCNGANGQHCACCEIINSQGGYLASAYKC